MSRVVTEKIARAIFGMIMWPDICEFSKTRPGRFTPRRRNAVPQYFTKVCKPQPVA